ncbi:BQ5605_C006g04316 [Microbotryum silenes-dioicae]|uniref:BQ5605_C006g04316 protein n=1 Tax=Microbotryum silenes-dioicae TaxID=796604 RepID=A0A2X0M6L4_9BASI|nr:BQ5605_C006g04316 [Microbotryum silenes-dioicae]
MEVRIARIEPPRSPRALQRSQPPLGSSYLEDGKELVVPTDTSLPIALLDESIIPSDGHPPPSFLAGVGPAPRIQRQFHFGVPSFDPPNLSLFTSSSSRKHLTGPLPRATFLPGRLLLIDETQRQHLSQFNFTRTINDKYLEELLAEHPDQPFVHSVVQALRHNRFKPEHDGSFHHNFIQQMVDEEVQKGWISSGTGTPLPGVTASGLNDRINRSLCPATYDTIIDFIRLLCWHRFSNAKGSLLGQDAVLWKLDVSSAFKILVMSERWQAMQGIAIKRRLEDGSTVTWYHIKWRGVFGCWAMPFLWTRFMSLLMWAAHCWYRIEHPLAYMDDTFGIDLVGDLVPFAHDGATYEIPAQQAVMARLWGNLWIPFKLAADKAPFGCRVTITGIDCNLDEFTVSLLHSTVTKLAAAIEPFLKTPDRHPTLRRWQQMAGWLSWALNVVPQARPYITPLYHKIRGKVNSDTGVPINKDMMEALMQVAVLIAWGPALDLASPSLTRWSLANADLVIYTDACLQNANDTGAGLGFWFATAGGTRRHFYCRPQRTYLRIQFAKLLTIIRALDIATDPIHSYGPFRRVLVRTNSAPAVYTLDSGAVHNTDFMPLRTLTLACCCRSVSSYVASIDDLL